MSSSRSPSHPDAQQRTKPRKIGDLPYTALRKLSNRLDTLSDGKETYWRKLVEVMPGLNYDLTTVERFALNAHKQDGSPAYALLTDMSNRGVAYDELITALKKLHLNTALHDLGYREGVRFTVQPEASPVVEGQRLELECEASGVPSPAYLWFKVREPLPEQTQRVLVLERVRQEDEGMYCCRATNDVNILFSNWAEVKVMKPTILNKTALPGSQPDAPVILQQPADKLSLYVDQELHVVLVAQGSGTLAYQWFRDGKKLPYATNNELFVSRVNLGDQGVYNCRVTSDLGGSVMSGDSVVTVMDPRQVQQPPPPINQTGSLSSIPTSTYLPTPGGPAPAIPLVQPVFIHEGIAAPFLATPTDPVYTPDFRPLPPDFTQRHYDPPGTSVAGGGFPPAPPEVGVVYTAGRGDTDHHHHGPHQHRGFIPNGVGSAPSGVPSVEDAPCGQPGEVHDRIPPNLDEPCYDKVALLIGNKNYRQSVLQLNTPENDTLDLAGVLRSAGFKVVSLVNLQKVEMEQAVGYFGSLIGKNVYALFFFAGHGFELNSTNYMMPVDADIDKNPEQCVCAQSVLQTMQLHGAKLSIVLLDMCRVSASTPTPYGGGIHIPPQPQGTNGYFVIGFSCSPAERAFEAGGGADDDCIREEDRENSIFVAALKEHLQHGSLRERLDTLLTDAAAGVRRRGKDIGTAPHTWMKPEIRHNLGEKLSLADEIKNGREVNFERQNRANLWQEAHMVPEATVVSCMANPRGRVKQGEIALRLYYEAEHSNVLLVTTELLNGCLASTDIIAMNMKLYSDGNLQQLLPLNAEMDKQYKYSPRSKYSRHQQLARANDLMHFKIPDIQKIKSQTVTLVVSVDYLFESAGCDKVRKSCEIRHALPPPLYAKVLCSLHDNSLHGNNVPLPLIGPFHHHGNMAQLNSH